VVHFQTTKSSKTPHLRYNHRPARSKFQSESSDFAPVRLTTKHRRQDDDYDDEDEEGENENGDDDDSSDFEVKTEKVKEEILKASTTTSPPAKSPSIAAELTLEDREEKDFMKRLSDFMTLKSLPMPKLAWMGLRDGVSKVLMRNIMLMLPFIFQ